MGVCQGATLKIQPSTLKNETGPVAHGPRPKLEVTAQVAYEYGGAKED